MTKPVEGSVRGQGVELGHGRGHGEVAGTGSEVANLTEREMLKEILVVVSQGQGRGRLEVVVAIVLSLATLCSTWCGYQAQQWGGDASSQQAASDTAERVAAESTIVALQQRTQDGLAILEYARALRAGDEMTSEMLFSHMRPMLQGAVKASIAGGILTNPEAPGPMQTPAYVLQDEIVASQKRQEAKVFSGLATKAGQYSGQYVLLTLMFASVLFFGGIGGTFTERRIRVALAGVAIVLFLITIGFLVQLTIVTNL